MDNIYEKLRARLDELATGYPETGAETYIRIMQERGKIQDLWVVSCTLRAKRA